MFLEKTMCRFVPAPGPTAHQWFNLFSGPSQPLNEETCESKWMTCKPLPDMRWLEAIVILADDLPHGKKTNEESI